MNVETTASTAGVDPRPRRSGASGGGTSLRRRLGRDPSADRLQHTRPRSFATSSASRPRASSRPERIARLWIRTTAAPLLAGRDDRADRDPSAENAGRMETWQQASAAGIFGIRSRPSSGLPRRTPSPSARTSTGRRSGSTRSRRRRVRERRHAALQPNCRCTAVLIAPSARGGRHRGGHERGRPRGLRRPST